MTAMTAEECIERAAKCVANASLAADEPVSLEFLKLAAQWRAMASRCIPFRRGDDAIVATPLNASRLPSA
jgi:hypothetical protein